MQTTSAVPRKVLFAASFGTFIEWYDFLAFGVLAAHIGALFFPKDNPTVGLLASLATFGMGMLVRPLGAAVFGSLADRHGRRPVFIATLVVMSLATLGVGALPTYGTIGIAAPVLLLLLRLVQGFAMGGEVGGVAVYLTEHAPPGKRGLYTSVLQLMGALGVMAALGQIALLQAWVGEAAFAAGWWRELFVFSGVLMAIFLVQRMSLQESPVFLQLAESKRVAHTPLRDCLTDRRTLGRMALLFFCVTAGGSLLFFSSQIYTKVFLETVVRLDGATIAGLMMVGTLALIPLTLLAGWLSDRIGRKPVMLAGLLLGALCIQPVYSGLLHFGNPALERFSRSVPVAVHVDGCHYNPFVKPRKDCERTLDYLTRQGVSYTLQPAVAGQALSVSIGGTDVAGYQPEAFSAALKARGWTHSADPQQANRLVLALLLLIPTLALALVTGPQTAVLAELFPARTRYTAAALPHNLSAGWIGGLSPFVVTLLSVQLGNVTAGLWYLVILLAVGFGIGLMFLPETRDVPLHE
jgi:MFS family permease